MSGRGSQSVRRSSLGEREARERRRVVNGKKDRVASLVLSSSTLFVPPARRRGGIDHRAERNKRGEKGERDTIVPRPNSFPE